MSNHKRNIEGIHDFAKKKTQIARASVDKAIQTLIKKKESINFSTVSEVAKVSKTFLYKHVDIKERIEKLRKQQYEVFSTKAVKRNTSNESKDRLIEVQREKIRTLQEEITVLREQLQQYYSQEYESL